MWLAAFPTGRLGAAVVMIGVLVSLAGLFVVRRVVPHSTLKQHNDVVGFVDGLLLEPPPHATKSRSRARISTSIQPSRKFRDPRREFAAP